MGGDTWACQPLTTRGSREVLIGIEVERITTDFPMVELQEATVTSHVSHVVKASDGLVGVAGNVWHPMTDTLELKLQPLHFGRTVRGRLAPDTKTFSGDTTTDRDMNNFVPKFLTRRQISSKHMGVFDIKGLLIPLTARCKRDLRDTFTVTPKWDHSVSPDLRAKWVCNFLDIE